MGFWLIKPWGERTAAEDRGEEGKKDLVGFNEFSWPGWIISLRTEGDSHNSFRNLRNLLEGSWRALEEWQRAKVIQRRKWKDLGISFVLILGKNFEQIIKQQAGGCLDKHARNNRNQRESIAKKLLGGNITQSATGFCP